MRRPGTTVEWIRATTAAVLTTLGIAIAAWALWHAQIAFTLTVLSLLVAVALDRVVAWLERHGFRRGVAIALVMLALLAAIGGLAFLFVPPAVAQLEQLAGSGPELLRSIEHGALYQRLARNVDVAAVLDRIRAHLPSVATRVVNEAVLVARYVAGGIAGVVTLLFIVVFMLASGRELVWTAMAKVRPERRPVYADVLSQLYRSLGGYIGGLFLLVLSNMVLSGLFLGVTGVRYFLPLAVFAGLSSLIPYAGAIAAGTVLSLVGWATGGLWLGVGTLAYFVTYQQVENHVLSPLVYRRTVDLNPLVVLLVVLFMAELGGVVGALVAVPLAATAQIVLRELFRLRRQALDLPRVEPGPELLDPSATRARAAEARPARDDPTDGSGTHPS